MMNTCAVILAGGQGLRMKSSLPKPMLSVLEEPMLEWVIKACESAGIADLCVVTGHQREVIELYLNGRYPTAVQEESKGTGHAVMQAGEFIRRCAGQDGNVLILSGSAPFMDKETIQGALQCHLARGNAVTVITAEAEDPSGYERVIRTPAGISAIVCEEEASPEQRKGHEISSGAYWFKAGALLAALDQLKPNTAYGEYFLNDTVYLLIAQGERADAYLSPNPKVAMGASSRRELLDLNTTARMDIISRHLENGVEFTCLDGVTIGREVVIGSGTHILAGTILKGKTVIGRNCSIGPNCLLENTSVGDHTTLNYVQSYDAQIGNEVKIGPFVHIRSGTRIRDGVKIGDFVEIKNSTIGEGTAVAHLTYLGDSDVGSRCNFGCGCVTANYDGVKKSRTTIGDNSFLGCQTRMIAPVTIGNGVYTAAGTTVTRDLPDNAFAVERGETKVYPNGALRWLKERK